MPIVLQAHSLYHGIDQRYNMHQYYSLHQVFLEDRRIKNYPLNAKRISYWFFEEELEANSDLKNNAMIKQIKNKYGVEISDNKVRREYDIKVDIVMLNLKYLQKILEKNSKKY